MNKAQIASDFNCNYSSVQNIIGSFEKFGRTSIKQPQELNYHYKITEEGRMASGDPAKRRGRKKLEQNQLVLDD